MLHDRDYMRSGPGSSSQGSFIQTVKGWSAIKTLVVLNVVFFALQIFLVDTQKDVLGRFIQKEWFTYQLILVPSLVRDGEVWRILTHMFAHGDFFHIFFNMFVLWNFGKPIEQMLGKKRFFYLYFFAGLVASFCYLGVNWVSNMPALGASGAVMGVFLASAVFMPHLKIFFFFIPIPIPIWKFVRWYAVISGLFLLGRLTGNDFGPNWAHSAHLGGMLGGWLFVKFFTKISLPVFGFAKWLSRFKVSRTEKTREKFTHVKGTKSTASSSDVDRILDKISSSGIDSLSNDEKAALNEARQKLRK